MPRNLDRRVEILFPIEKAPLQEKIWHILECQLKDTVKASILQPDGSYEKVDKRGKEIFNAQLAFCKEAKSVSREETQTAQKRIFIPKMHHND